MSLRGDENEPAGETELSRLQRWFQAVITDPRGVESGTDSASARKILGVGNLHEIVTPSKTLTAEARLGIYANAYFARLLECLGEVYPVLKRSLGENLFNEFAVAYLRETPSRSYTLNELGRRFPGYLAATRPAATPARAERARAADWADFWVDLACLEWALYEVFDGPGIEAGSPLAAEDLMGITPDRWEKARIELAPCVRLVESRFPLNDYYTASRRASGEQPVLPSANHSFLALNRRDYKVWRYPLDKPAFELLLALRAGATLTEALEAAAAATAISDEDLAAEIGGWFQTWANAGFFTRVQLDKGENLG